MESARWHKLEEIFQTAAERPFAERAAYLTQACGGDQALRHEIEALLDCQVYDTFIHAPIQDATRALAVEPERELIGQQLGPYRVTELIGQGGMGAVYAAVRADEQFEQRVAIKLVRRGMDSSFVLSRFQHERQILASLEHPNIARLLDGGATPGGRPYFVMEFIEGQTLSEYCDTEQLGINERIKLFRQVCAAVQYAHRQLVVHRDLKPGNILVTAEGVPKLLDFGLAKLLDPAQTAADPARTATLLRMMTPAYASPEQVRGNAVTTATDVYSLGAVLYELLSGQPAHRLESYTPSEIERVICEEEIKRPSSLPHSAFRLPPSKLRGELDNIILLALRKEPERRYASVEQFSDDLLRYLEDRPVTARGAGVGYRAGKFVRRHKLGVLATALVLVSLLGGLALANYQARRAERRFQQVRKLANTFLFDFHDKIQHLAGATEARELVVQTALEYLGSLAQDAAGDTALENELAVAYQKVGDVQGDPFMFSLGHSDAARQSYQKCVDLAQKLAARDPGNRPIRQTLSQGYFKLGVLQSESGDKTNGLITLRQALSVAEPLAAETADPQVLVILENCYDRIGDIQLDTGDSQGALESYRQTQQVTEKRAAAYPSDKAQYALGVCYSHLGETLLARGDPDSALENFRQYQMKLAALVKKEPANAFYRRNLSNAYQWLGQVAGHPRWINLGDDAAALRAFRQMRVIVEELSAADPKNTQARHDLATSYAKEADVLLATTPRQSVALYQKALALLDTLLATAPENFRFRRRYASYLRSLAVALLPLHDRQAQPKARQSLEIVEALITKNPTNADLQKDLCDSLTALGDTQLALAAYEAALDFYRSAMLVAETAVTAHPTDLYARTRLAEAYASLGQYETTRAAQPGQAAAQLDHWRAAHAWLSKALAVWDDWGKHGVSSVFNTTRRAQAARAVARSQARLRAAE